MGGYTQISLAAFLVQVMTLSDEARDRMTGPNSTLNCKITMAAPIDPVF